MHQHAPTKCTFPQFPSTSPARIPKSTPAVSVGPAQGPPRQSIFRPRLVWYSCPPLGERCAGRRTRALSRSPSFRESLNESPAAGPATPAAAPGAATSRGRAGRRLGTRRIRRKCGRNPLINTGRRDRLSFRIIARGGGDGTAIAAGKMGDF